MEVLKWNRDLGKAQSLHWCEFNIHQICPYFDPLGLNLVLVFDLGYPNSNRIDSKMATFEQLIPSEPSLSRETQTLQFCHMVSLRHFKTRLEDKLDFYGCLNSILIKMQSKNLWLKFSFLYQSFWFKYAIFYNGHKTFLKIDNVQDQYYINGHESWLLEIPCFRPFVWVRNAESIEFLLFMAHDSL